MALRDKFFINPQKVLSKQEYRVFLLIAEGKYSKEIQHIMSISRATVTTYVGRICNRLAIKGGMAAIMIYAHVGGWTKADPDILVVKPTVPDYYTTAELVAITKQPGYTIRERKLAKTCLGLIDQFMKKSLSGAVDVT